MCSFTRVRWTCLAHLPTQKIVPERSDLPIHFHPARPPAVFQGSLFSSASFSYLLQSPRMSATLSIGFLGAGKMASALAKGFIRAGLVTPERLIASDPIEAARTAFTKETGAKTVAANSEVAKFANVLVLAVKPDQTGGVLAEVRDLFTDQHLLISIAAGVPLAKLESALKPGARIIRVI